MNMANHAQLRDNQERVLTELDQWFQDNPDGNPIVDACVSSGKSVMIAEFCRRAVLDFPEYRARILMLVPQKELVIQNWEKLVPMMKDIYVGVISASLGRKDTGFNKDVIIATVGSVAKNPGSLGRIDLILIDECHLVNTKDTGQYRKLINDCKRYNPDIRTIGWTGTPYRGNGVWLTEGAERLFTDIAARITIREQLEHEPPYASPLVTATTDITVSAEGVKLNSDGDYIVTDLAKRLDQTELTQKIVKSIASLGQNRKKWMIFCANVSHAQHMTDELTSLGIPVVMVCGDKKITPDSARTKALSNLKAGRIRGIVNVACMTTGVDVPDLDLIALVRNTRSPVLYVQIAGRGMRIDPTGQKQDCLWLDYTDTTLVLGPVDQVKGRGETKTNRSEDSSETTAVHKICPECGCQVATATNACKCGYQFPSPTLKINETPNSANILAEEVFTTYTVSKVTYSHYRNLKKQDAPPTLKVSYWSGMKMIVSEWVCLEHTGYAKAKAERWWNARINSKIPLPTPAKIDDALKQTHFLKIPNSIIVKEGSDWPELIRCVFNEDIFSTPIQEEYYA